MFSEIDLNTLAFCISINSKRYEYLCKNFESVGLNSPKLFRGVRWNRGSNLGCVLAHISLLNMCKFNDYPYCIVYEDDAYPRPDVLEMWDKIKHTIPFDCGFLKLGSSSYRGNVKVINKYINVMESGSAYGSHAYIIKKELYDFVIDNMLNYGVPESFLNLEIFKDQIYKPYILNYDSLLFIQKNINIDNIISNKGGERYWFPSKEKGIGCTSGKPCEHFVDQLIYDENKYIDTLCIIECSRFSKSKKTGIVKDDFLYTKDESGHLTKITDNTYYIDWDNTKLREILVFEYEADNIKYYKVKGL